MKTKLNKKGQITGAFSQLPAIAILLGISVVIFSVMADVVQKVRNTQTAGTGAANMSDKGLDLFENIGAQFPLLGTITILGIVVLVLISVFGNFIRLRA